MPVEDSNSPESTAGEDRKKREREKLTVPLSTCGVCPWKNIFLGSKMASDRVQGPQSFVK